MEILTAAIPLQFTYKPPPNSTTTSSTTPFMDPNIWSNLPPKLLDRVLAFLPPPAFFRARCVCRRWYSLLFSAPFLDLHLSLSPRRPCFLFFHHQTLKSPICRNTTHSSNPTPHTFSYLLDPSDSTWHRIPSPHIPPGFSPAASSGGLICWVSDEPGPKSLLLSNPITGAVSPLPLAVKPRLFPSIGLVVGPSSIDVAVAGDDLISPYAVKNLSTEAFHVDLCGFYSLWGTTAPLPRLCSLESGEMVSAGGRLYCMNHNPFSVLAYELSSNTWAKIEAPMRRYLRSPSLLEVAGEVVLAAAVEKSKLNVPKSLRLWRLESSGATWEKMEVMPQQLFAEFSGIEKGKGFSCVGHGEFVVLVIRGSEKALLFDVRRRVWRWVPPCPYNNGGSGNGGEDEERELHGFAYEPRLAVPVTALLDQLTLTFQSLGGFDSRG